MRGEDARIHHTLASGRYAYHGALQGSYHLAPGQCVLIPTRWLCHFLILSRQTGNDVKLSPAVLRRDQKMNTNVYENTGGELYALNKRRNILPVFSCLSAFTPPVQRLLNVGTAFLYPRGWAVRRLSFTNSPASPLRAFSQFLCGAGWPRTFRRALARRYGVLWLAAAISFTITRQRNVSCLSCSPARFFGVIAPGICVPQPILPPIVRTIEIGAGNRYPPQAYGGLCPGRRVAIARISLGAPSTPPLYLLSLGYLVAIWG